MLTTVINYILDVTTYFMLTTLCKVSDQGVAAQLAAILQHYVRSLIFMKQFFFIINFQKEKANSLTLLIILTVKSLQIKLHSTNLLL